VRGRFAELLGQSFLPRAEAENLFVAGMFSLLDLLLGVSMEEVLDSIQLSEAVTQALLTRDGIFGPFLALAEACEKNNGTAGPLAEALFISASQVNEAHLAALVWAQSLKL
jgi:c-di-GMP-related signal transduction protein